MTARVFVDANIFVYALQPNESVKRAVAIEWIDRLWAEQRGYTSMQILNECYSVVTRGIRPHLSRDQAWAYVRTLVAWEPCPVTAEVSERARQIEARWRLNWWDCLIVSAAQLQNCAVLLTEDLQEGALYDTVRVRNPFRLGVNNETVPPPYGDVVAALPSWPRSRRRRLLDAAIQVGL